MGIFKKLGLRKLWLGTMDIVKMIQLFQLKDGLHLYNGLNKAGTTPVLLQPAFLKGPLNLRSNFSDKAIFEQVFIEKQYTPKDYKLPAASTILDAGANVGFAAVFFAEKYPKASILAIEPDTDNYRLLEQNTRNYTNIKSFRGAVWGRDEAIHINNPESLAASYMVEKGEGNGATALPGKTIPSFMAQMGWQGIDIVKMDIEGAEKEVFEGNTDWLKKVKLLIVELHDRYKPGCTKALFKALEAHEYECFFHHENIFITLNPSS